ncbi:DUF402 domain-containing protein [Microbacterium sp. MYb62]|uniref:DUF402 domain-containing protein n=1 Tax=Microbacterium sp. MYb62 TaxID=1848690 RepID=UPI000CFA9116|nr:DUF402 domain-containing protein [Microbacterium sp. MYb62]PRB12949.1 DUF402 domain-containing protein [Microbacterium sp. MYb62]
MTYARSGEEILLRYRYPDGRVQAAIPLRAVEDDAARTVAWLSPGTEISYWALQNGRDPRELPLDERFRHPMITARRTWQGSGVLRVMPAGAAYQVLHFWDEGRFAGWYVNLERPRMRRGSCFDSVDQHLDLAIAADGSHTWKDADEAQAAVDAGHLPEADLAAARATGEAVIADIDVWLGVVGDWREWSPPAGFDAPLTLPAGWDAR